MGNPDRRPRSHRRNHLRPTKLAGTPPAREVSSRREISAPSQPESKSWKPGAIAPTLLRLNDKKEPWHPLLAVTLRRMIDSEKNAPGSREEKIQAACDRFYGRHDQPQDIADELEAFYIARGGFLRKADLAAHHT